MTDSSYRVREGLKNFYLKQAKTYHFKDEEITIYYANSDEIPEDSYYIFGHEKDDYTILDNVIYDEKKDEFIERENAQIIVFSIKPIKGQNLCYIYPAVVLELDDGEKILIRNGMYRLVRQEDVENAKKHDSTDVE